MVDDPISIEKTINLIGDYVSYVDILLEDLSVITIREKITVPYRAYNVDNFDIRGESGGFLSYAGFVLEAKEVGRFNIAVSGYDIDYAESIRVNIEEPSYEVEVMMAALAVYDRDNRAVRYLQYRSWPTASNYLDSTSGYIDPIPFTSIPIMASIIWKTPTSTPVTLASTMPGNWITSMTPTRWVMTYRPARLP